MMTQQVERETLALVVSIAVFARAIFPRPLIEGSSKKPYENQLVARLCYVAFGVFVLLVWLSIHREGTPGH